MTFSEVARELGLYYHWDERTIIWELGNLAKALGITRFPKTREFKEKGKAPLLLAIRCHGGKEKFSKLSGLLRTTIGSGTPNGYWSNERIESDLAEFCKGRDFFQQLENSKRLDSTTSKQLSVERGLVKMSLLKNEHKPTSEEYRLDRNLSRKAPKEGLLFKEGFPEHSRAQTTWFS